MHEAAQRGETRQLQQLIESGACVNQVMVDSITPLHAASLQGQAQCVQLLLAAGAQVSHLQHGPQTDGTSSREKEAWEERSVLCNTWEERKPLQEAEKERKEETRVGCSGG